jgi:glycosyltransferase involved in cell wall biosynthesis
MKLLMISAAFPPLRAGESDHALQICTRLAGAGIDVHLVTTRGSEARAGLPFRVWPIMKDWSWLALPRLTWFMRRSAPDAVLLLYTGWLYNDHPMITFAPTVARCVLPNARFVTQLETEGAPGDAFGTLLRDSNQLIVLSEHHLARFEALLPGVRTKCVVIPPPPLMRMSEGGDTGRARSRAMLGANDSEFLLAFFGYVDRNKGIETLFKAIEIVGRRCSHVRLIMVGGGRGTVKYASTTLGRAVRCEEEELLDLPRSMGISEMVTWTPGYAWDSDEGSLYLRAADAAVLPFEAGVTLDRSTVAAAAAHDLPIITTRGQSVESVFRDRENCLLCPVRDAESLATAIVSLVEDSELRERLRLGSSSLAREWFSWDRATEQTIQALQARTRRSVL